MITLVGLSACTETNLAPDRQEKGRQVLFTVSPVKTADTRAVTTQSFSTSQTFGTTAFAIDAGTTWKAATEGSATISTTDIKNKEISYQGGVWKAGQSYYWEDFEGKSLTFLSWSPFNLVSTSSTTAGLTITDDHDFSYTGWTMQNTAGYGYTKDDDGNYIRNTEDGSVDLLLAKSTDITENTDGGRVLTQFVHQLCNVKINARIIDEPTSGEQWHIYKVALSGIYTKGNLLKAATINKSNSADDEPLYNTQIWGSQSDTLTYTYEKVIDLVYSENQTKTEIFPQTLMLPQSVLKNSGHEPKVTIYYKDEHNAEKKLYGYLAPNSNSTLTAWLAGKSITYSINISTQEYYINFDADVDVWSDGSSTEISVGN